MKQETRALVRYRMERAWESMEEASLLFERGHFNTAVNRLYYACFYAVNSLLLTRSLSASKHSGVRAMFQQHFVRTGSISSDLGKYLANLKDDRESGDYEAFSYVDKETAERAVREAKEFVKETTGYLTTLGALS